MLPGCHILKHRSRLHTAYMCSVHCRHFLYTQHPCSITNSSFLAHKHTHTFNGPLSGTTHMSWYQKVKPIWILLEQETVSGSGISWAICKSTHRSRIITTPAPHHSFFTGRMPFLPPNQQRQSTEGPISSIMNVSNIFPLF